MLTDDFLKQSIQNATDCYRAGMEAQRTVSPSVGEFAVQENARLREEVSELRGAIQEIVRQRYGTCPGGGCVKVNGVLGITMGLEDAIVSARAALAKVPA